MNGWTDIGEVQSVPPLGSRIVRTPDGDIAVFRTDSDEFFALTDRCPHRGGPLSQGIVHGRRVTCPLHNLVIALDTGQAIAPDTGCVRAYGVKIEGDRLLLAKKPHVAA